MPFIDELKITLSAGQGGDGVISWLHEKGKEFMGPAGGDGGRGGDVYARAVSDIAVLATYRHTKSLTAKDGEKGLGKGKHGKAGESLYIDVPVGTVLTNAETLWQYDLTEVGQEVRLLVGGEGGFGNRHFKNSHDTKPTKITTGRAGMKALFHFELRLIADVGIVGLPNAGKSSLLNAMTRSGARVGDYAFTTLTPNLGVSGNFVLADVPGLIEGASGGKGLGHAFLRHLRRTKILLHVVASDEADILSRYNTIRSELLAFDTTFQDKKEIIVITKSDIVSKKDSKHLSSVLSKASKNPTIVVSSVDSTGIKDLQSLISKTLE